MLFLAAEIDFLKWNCVRSLEPSLKTFWRHWLYSLMMRYGFSPVFTWFIQVYSSNYRYLLVLHFVISVQPWQKIHIIDVRGHQSVDSPKWMLQIRTAQYILYLWYEAPRELSEFSSSFHIHGKFLYPVEAFPRWFSLRASRSPQVVCWINTILSGSLVTWSPDSNR